MPKTSLNIRLAFDDGTLVLLDADQNIEPPSPFIWDSRVDRWRAQAHRYRDVVEAFQAQDAKIKNVTPRYNHLKLNFNREHEPHPHQTEAFDAWRSNGHRGVVVLPTGSGKSLLALMAIAEINRSTLIVAPTIDLMNQWYDLLKGAFSCDIGILGGGRMAKKEVADCDSEQNYVHRLLAKRPDNLRHVEPAMVDAPEEDVVRLRRCVLVDEFREDRPRRSHHRTDPGAVELTVLIPAPLRVVCLPARCNRLCIFPFLPLCMLSQRLLQG